MKKFAIILLALTLVASMAMAFEKPKEAIPSHATYVGSDITKQGGEDIGTALAIPGLPYSDSGTTVGYAHDYTLTTETAGDVVYAYTQAVDMIVDILLCDSGYDTKVGVLLADATVVYYNDDNFAICGSGFRSALIGVRLTAGVPYYIVVSGFGATEGEYVLDVTGEAAPPPLPGELCETAVEAVEGLNSCPGANFWYSYTAPVDGCIFLDSCIPDQFVDTLVGVFDACGGVLLDSDDDGGGCEGGSGLSSYGDCSVSTVETNWASLKGMYR